jgi:steroid 5-alpha reductase family enzyme
MTALTLGLFATAAASIFLAGSWVYSRARDNAGWVDVAWSYSFTVILVVLMVLGSAPAARKAVLAVMVGSWSLRLGTHLALRVARKHPEEDPRYAPLRAMAPRRTWTMFFFFYQFQALAAGILSIPFYLVASNVSAAMAPVEITAIVLWGLAMGGEVLADAQLSAFRKDPGNAGKVCDVGLWRYSRHPNYFFEWVVWISFALLAFGSPHAWLAIIPPVLMFFLLTRVTGIPPAEAQSLRSRGDAYRAYQKRTSPFIPLPPAR